MDMWTLAQGLLVSTSAVLFFLWLVSKKTDATKNRAPLPNLPAEFTVTVWLKALYWSIAIVSGIGACIVLIYVREPEKLMIGLGLPGLFGLIAIGGLISTMENLRITESTLTYKKLWGGFSLPLSNIKSVQAGMGYIHIGIRNSKKATIPMQFKGSGQILKLLESLVKRQSTTDRMS